MWSGRTGRSRSGPRRARKLVVQRKLTVGAVDDPQEREADAVAAAVVQRLSAPVTEGDAPAGRIRRSATAASSGAAFEPAPEVENRIQRAMTGGAPLEAGVRGQFEGALGADLGNVRVHRDAEAGALSRELSAQAFTAGNHVFFGERTYSPGSSSGQHLLLPADKAWAAAGVQAQRMLNPEPIPQQQPVPSSGASAQPPSGGPGEGNSGGGQKWVPGRRWKAAQPSNA